MDMSVQSDGETEKNGVPSHDRRFLEMLTNAGWSMGNDIPTSFALVGCHRQSGVSTMVRETAIAAANSGASVLVIDCNVQHPTVHRQFGTKSQPGLCQSLINSSILTGSIHETDTPGVSVMPLGRSRFSTHRYKEAFRILLNIVMGDYDLVLLDMPEISPRKRTLPWYSTVDGVILVAEPGQINAVQAQAIQVALKRVGANVCGVALNRFTGERK